MLAKPWDEFTREEKIGIVRLKLLHNHDVHEGPESHRIRKIVEELGLNWEEEVERARRLRKKLGLKGRGAHICTPF